MPLLYLIILILLPGFTHCSYALEYNVQSGLHYSSWKSNHSDKGSEIYMPIGLSTTYKDLRIDLNTAGIYAQADSSRSGEQSLTTLLDTKLGLTYTRLSMWDMDFMAGLDLNLPTGKTGLNDDGLDLLIDPDLNEISSFGEGFNVNPTLSMVKDWKRITAGVGIGYAYRGKYDYSASTPDYDPGEIFNLTTEIDFSINHFWLARVFSEYASFSKDKAHGQSVYQNGDYYLFGLGARYKADQWQLSSALEYTIRDKGKAYTQNIRDDHNNNGDEWNVSTDFVHKLGISSYFYANVAFLNVAKNDFEPSSRFYVGKRQKISCKLGINHPLSNNLTTDLYLAGFVLDVDRTIFQSEPTTYRGFSIGGAIQYHF